MKYLIQIGAVIASLVVVSACGDSHPVNPVQVRALDATGTNGSYRQANAKCSDSEATILSAQLYPKVTLILGGGQLKYISYARAVDCTASLAFDTAVNGSKISFKKSGYVRYSGTQCGRMSVGARKRLEAGATTSGVVEFSADSKVIKVTAQMPILDRSGHSTGASQEVCSPFVRQ